MNVQMGQAERFIMYLRILEKILGIHRRGIIVLEFFYHSSKYYFFVVRMSDVDDTSKLQFHTDKRPYD